MEETFGSLWEIVVAAWNMFYAAVGGVAEASVFLTALAFLVGASWVFKKYHSFALDLAMAAVMGAAVFVGLGSMYVVRDSTNGVLTATLAGIVVAAVAAVMAITDANNWKLRLIDIAVVALLIGAFSFNFSSLAPESRVGQLALSQIEATGTFLSTVFNDARAQIE